MTRVADIRPRMLMGPGPSDVHPRVLSACAHPTVGHLDGQFLEILNGIRDMLRDAFRTRNELTLAVSGTGSAGMETCVVNLLEPGDRMLVCVNGVFGRRMTDVAERAGADVAVIEVPWGKVFAAEQVEAAVRDRGPFKVVGMVHAETSTGAAQPIVPISEVVHAHGALLLVDTVTSLAGMEVSVDEWRIDACYSGTQKCLSCPPGLAPVTFSAAAEKAIAERKTKVRSWYLDMNMVRSYWGSERLYHHTAPVNANYGLHEALRIVLEEGLEARWKRHAEQHLALKKELEAMGLEYLADPDHQLPMLNAVSVPESVLESGGEASVRRRLLEDHGIEIGGGLGEFKGKAWRIGLMGESATARHVGALTSALKEILG